MVIHIEITFQKLVFWGKILLSLIVVAAVIMFSARCSQRFLKPEDAKSVVEEAPKKNEKNEKLEDAPQLTKEEFDKTNEEYMKILEEAEAKAEKARKKEKAKRRMLDEIPWQHKGRQIEDGNKSLINQAKTYLANEEKKKKKKKKKDKKKKKQEDKQQNPEDRRGFQNGH